MIYPYIYIRILYVYMYIYYFLKKSHNYVFVNIFLNSDLLARKTLPIKDNHFLLTRPLRSQPMPNARSARGLTPARASYYYELEARLPSVCKFHTHKFGLYERKGYHNMGVNPKIRGKPPKWMVKIMENPIKMDDLGGHPYFWKHPYDKTMPFLICYIQVTLRFKLF